MGAPEFAACTDFGGLGHGGEAEGDAEAVAHTEVVDRQDVGSAELEDEEHLGGPAADAADGDKAFDDGFVLEFRELGASGNDALERFGRDVAEGGGFGGGEARGAQLFIRHGAERTGGGKAGAGEEGEKAL